MGNFVQVLASAAAGVALAAPLCASAQQSPISVRSCTMIAYSASSKNQFFYLQSGPPSQSNRNYTDGLKISYVNTSNKVASRVGFRVTYGGQSERIIDAGTFSPGAVITHTFGEFSGKPYLGSQPSDCRPIGVRFQDGSIWRASSVP